MVQTSLLACSSSRERVGGRRSRLDDPSGQGMVRSRSESRQLMTEHRRNSGAAPETLSQDTVRDTAAVLQEPGPTCKLSRVSSEDFVYQRPLVDLDRLVVASVPLRSLRMSASMLWPHGLTNASRSWDIVATWRSALSILEVDGLQLLIYLASETNSVYG